ncbi:MAG TPA: NfeD family protein [Aestuariivirgaceae bacterium]|jgi:inner membrane protein|nr:NfeD family protein [Aestuariivirgaceae bacterium]
MAELFPALGQWVWWILAGLLLIVELLLAGIFFVWLGIAAAIMGVIDFLAPPLSWQVEILIFATLSAVLVIAGRPWLKRRQAVESDQPNLNRRIQDYVGRSYVLDEAIINGRGKVKIDDTLWEVTGPDLPQGAWVRIVGVDGLRLRAMPGN